MCYCGHSFASSSAHLIRGELCRPDGLLTHRDKFLGGTWVDADSLVELPLGGAAFDGNREALDDLRCIRSQHVAAEHPVAARVDDELHQGALLAAGQRVFHRLEARYVDMDLGSFPAGLLLRKAQRAACG